MAGNGIDFYGTDGLTLQGCNTVGEYWTARVTPMMDTTDHMQGEFCGAKYSAQSTSVIISPNPVFTGSTLTCSALASDQKMEPSTPV